MSSILDEFPIFRNVEQNIKREIKLFYVKKAQVIECKVGFFVTKDDQVYGVGLEAMRHYFGIDFNSDEFGEKSDLELMHELCDKNICEFYIDYSIKNYFALSLNSEIYAWSYNYKKNKVLDESMVNYMKPKRIDFFNDKKIVKISVFSLHCFALSLNGTVYKFSPDFWIDSQTKLITRYDFYPDNLWQRVYVQKTFVLIRAK